VLPEHTNEYRDLAEQCLAFAAAVLSVEAKAVLVELASKWRHLAELAAKNGGHQPQSAMLRGEPIKTIGEPER
jgi:hypothetical protein